MRSSMPEDNVIQFPTERAALLDEAKKLTTGDRNNQYGPPTQDFARTADLLNAMGYRGPQGRGLISHDVALIMGQLKLSRLVWSPEKRDSWVDLAGYAACGWECVTDEQNSRGEMLDAECIRDNHGACHLNLDRSMLIHHYEECACPPASSPE